MNSKKLSEYELLTKQVKEFVNDIENKSEFHKIFKRYYRGIQILYGPLIFQPEILFIGINPGAGYFNEKKENVKRYNPLKNFEYIHFNYLLARQTRELFKMANIKSLNSCVKTNCFFFSTKNKSDLDNFLSNFKEQEIYKKSAIWRHKLIEIIEPQIIICEGFSAFEWVTKKYTNIEIERNDKFLYVEVDNIKIIGYKRRMSLILHNEEVSKVLKAAYNRVNS
ncbi:hypothetical protein [uncultured Lacinutrix sp.]|uniref:hypothetical protein n=1 Tax=uncultured Lacinutrix sp. TaxID=574032 RepID=UPI002634426F|nr:hypothetical protein [uncultured Lacinutrix sp.]